MKKGLILVLILLICTPVFAQMKRGALPNVFASWFSVTNTQTTITPPNNSRDITIHNGSTSTGIIVSLRGDTIPDSVVTGSYESASAVLPNIFQLTANTAFSLSDFITSSISFTTISGTASPVSVIITY